MEFNFYSKYESGHRTDYINFCSKYLDGRRTGLVNGIFAKEPLLFLMLEECFFTYIFVSALRKLFAKKTACLTFRANLLLNPISFRLKLKLTILIWLKKLNIGKVISIIPFDLEPRLSDFCSGQVPDFQYWDKEFLEKNAKYSDSGFDFTNFHSKKIVVTLGNQNKDKAVDVFVRILLDCPELNDKYTFIIAGKIKDMDGNSLEKFKSIGGVVFDEFVSDSFLIDLYRNSHYVWCCYSPNYDQSSGILGRTIQYGKIPIVRKGSVAEKICVKHCTEYVVLDPYSKNSKFLDFPLTLNIPSTQLTFESCKKNFTEQVTC